MSFYSGTQSELLYSLPAAVTKNTYTTQAPFSAVAASAPVATVPGGFFGSVPNGVGRSLYLRAQGTIANTAAATFAVALGLDTTAGTIANSVTVMAATAPVAAVTAPFTLEAWYTCQAVATGAGMTLQVNGRWVMEGAASGAAAVSTALATGFQASITGLSATQQYFIELFGTWSASSASNSTVLQQMFLFGLN